MFSDTIPFWYSLFGHDNYFGIAYFVLYFYCYMKKDFYLLFIPFIFTIAMGVYFIINMTILISPFDDFILLVLIILIIFRMNESKLETDTNDKQ